MSLSPSDCTATTQPCRSSAGKADSGDAGFMCATTAYSAARCQRRRCSIIRAISGEHPVRHLAGYAWVLQADAYSGHSKLYEVDRQPVPIVEAARWVHPRRKFFVLLILPPMPAAKPKGRV
jgi:hypothetical protein